MARATRKSSVKAEKGAITQDDLLATEPTTVENADVENPTSAPTNEETGANETMLELDKESLSKIPTDIPQQDENTTPSGEPKAEVVVKQAGQNKVIAKIINKGAERYEPYIQQIIPHGESVIELETLKQKHYLTLNLEQLNLLFGRKQFVVE